MSYPSRRTLTPGASKKRKERGALSYSMKPKSASAQPASNLDEPISSNRLLAGYMAYEFLTEGTLLGQKFDPARAEVMSLAGGSVECSKRGEPGKKKEHKSYAEVDPDVEAYWHWYVAGSDWEIDSSPRNRQEQDCEYVAGSVWKRRVRLRSKINQKSMEQAQKLRPSLSVEAVFGRVRF
ncbi:hypothetical protein POTOM_037636 [Populus tomentosa]|uniref:Uncharacterized protein n=1 Tax=Populus tomentosa TaxID=118781 RepID=A0A8X7YPX4_POPTO|nr:hypothetical protein POTOM_037636 [Populus tomentosa]